jgi:hypothetical protein
MGSPVIMDLWYLMFAKVNTVPHNQTFFQEEIKQQNRISFENLVFLVFSLQKMN